MQVIPMKKRTVPILILLVLALLTGCAKEHQPPATAAVPETSLPEATVPPDGNADDATCRGSYSSDDVGQDIIGEMGESTLTNQQLQFYYLSAIGSYLQQNPSEAPDLSRDLDSQSCPIDGTVNSWQQYFLKQALSTWHTAQALCQMAQERGLPVEPEYAPPEGYYEEYMDGMPATKYMYRYTPYYTPNTMHQNYLDSLPQVFETLAKELGFASAQEMARALCGTDLDTLVQSAVTYNTGYMYLSTMGDYLKPEEEEIQRRAASDTTPDGQTPYVDFRQVLLKPETNQADSWTECEESAQKMLKDWSNYFRKSEGTFAELAYRNSADTATSLLGGAYQQIEKGTLLPELDSWLFDPARESGDTTVLRSELGIHILYYTGGYSLAYANASDALFAENLLSLAQEAKETYPASIHYSEIRLVPVRGEKLFSFSDVLYADVAHERFPEIPLYLQQDYGITKYGNYPLRTYGCGITSLAMLSTYMTDTELTPPEMCRRYGNYCHSDGTDGMIFINEPPVLGYFFKERVFSPDDALKALEDGYVVVSLQNFGYWTSKGHYIVLEKVDEDGVQVRDSNVYNYKKLPAHKNDRHAWKNIYPNNVSWWVFEKKQVRSPLCTRCGDPNACENSILNTDYLCQKCRTALCRRNLYLSL